MLPQEAIRRFHRGDLATAVPAAAVPARCQIGARCAPSPAVSRPRSSQSPVLQRPSHLAQPLRLTGPPAAGVKKWLPRSLYRAQNRPLRSITSRNPAITVAVDSSSTNCA